MEKWKSTAMGVIYAIIIYSVAGLLTGLCEGLDAASGIADLYNGDFNAGPSIWSILSWLFLIAELGGFIWFFMNLSKFIGLQQNDADRNAVTMIRNGYIVSVIGVVLGLLPAAGWILALVCGIVSLIMLIIGYGNFAKSTFMNAIGKSGASLLKVGVIISLIGIILGLIPFIGWVLALICSIVYIILLFMGWTKVSNGAAA